MKSLNNNNGMTLIEVIVALAVLAIGILSLYSMQIGAINGNAIASKITESSNAAQDKIEELLSKDYGDSDFNVGTHTEGSVAPITSINWVVTSWRSDGISNDGDTYIDEFDERGVKAVQLTVNYLDRGKAKTTTINFIKAEIF